MLSSSNIIKNNKIINQGKKQIITDGVQLKAQSIDEIKEIIKKNSDNGISPIEKFDEIAQTILDNAKAEAETIRVNAISSAEIIKSDAYNKGYEDGSQKGYNDAYNETVVKGRLEAENISKDVQKKASQIIKDARMEYEKYLLDKRIDIKNLALSIAEQILKREVREEEGIDSMIYDAVNKSKHSKLIVIKCNKLHCEAIRTAAELWKTQIPLKGDIFVIEDNFIVNGNALIEKDNGKIEIGIDIGLDKVKNEIMK